MSLYQIETDEVTQVNVRLCDYVFMMLIIVRTDLDEGEAGLLQLSSIFLKVDAALLTELLFFIKHELSAVTSDFILPGAPRDWSTNDLNQQFERLAVIDVTGAQVKFS